MSLGRPERVRAAAAFGLLFLLLLALAGRLYAIQVRQHADLSRQAREQQWRHLTLAPKRGDILDRSGEVLARSIATWSVVADPKLLRDRALAAEMLAGVLSLPPAERERLLVRLSVPGRRFAFVKRRVTDREAARVRDLEIEGVWLEREYRRVYPRGELGEMVLGRVGIEGGGLTGVELTFDATLAGAPGFSEFEVDCAGRPVDRGHDRGRPARDGASVRLTVDAEIQAIAEAALDRVMAEWKPAGATAVVLDPAGRLLAVANRPAPGRNRALADFFEPGSVMKGPIAAFAREEGVVGPSEVLDGGVGQFGKRRIKDDHPVGRVPFPEAITHSSNRIMAQLGLRLGPERLQRALSLYGFGRPTGIPLPWEATGMVTSARGWTSYSTTSVPMGQEVGVTALQMARAYLPFVAGGEIYPVSLIERVEDAQGRVLYGLDPRPSGRCLRPEIALEMRGVLVRVVEEGTGKKAKIEGIAVGGKTGTAEKFGPHGRIPGKYFSSFVAFAPAEAPAVVVYVSVDEPTGAIYGGSVAAPAVRQIIIDGLRALGRLPGRAAGGQGDAVGMAPRGGAAAR